MKNILLAGLVCGLGLTAASAQEIKPGKAYFVHINHNMGKIKDVNKTLPAGVELAYDGLSFEF